jgi:hypothetical protein
VLLFLCGGRKTEKLSAAFGMADVDGDGALSAAQLSGLLRGLLVSLAGLRSAGHMAGESEEERAALAWLPESASEMARGVMRSSGVGRSSALGSITFQELCAHYNGGGALGALGFLELLDFKKVRGLLP